MDKKRKVIYGIVSLLFLSLLSISVFSLYSSNPPASILGGMTRYGSVCISTTGDFDGRQTPPHDGYVELVGCDHNLVVDEGLNATRDILGQGTSFGAFDVISLCNATAGCGTPVATDVNQENEFTSSGLSRASGTYGVISGSAGNWTIYNTFTSSDSANLQTNKTCLHNQTTVAGDTMLACNTFTLVTLDGTAGDQLTVNWTNFVTSG